MASITNDVIDVLVKLGLIQSNGGGGVAPSLRKATDANNNTVLVGADGDPLLTVEQPSKNIIANIIPRTGDLVTELLPLAGGAGEISSDPTNGALVLHSGVGGGAKAFYPDSPYRTIYCTMSKLVPTATETTMVFGSKSGDVDGIIDLATGAITISGYRAYEISVRITYPANTTGTYRCAGLITKVGTWNTALANGNLITNPRELIASGLFPQSVYIPPSQTLVGGGGLTDIAVVAYHNATVSLACGGSVVVRLWK